MSEMLTDRNIALAGLNDFIANVSRRPPTNAPIKFPEITITQRRTRVAGEDLLSKTG